MFRGACVLCVSPMMHSCRNRYLSLASYSYRMPTALSTSTFLRGDVPRKNRRCQQEKRQRCWQERFVPNLCFAFSATSLLNIASPNSNHGQSSKHRLRTLGIFPSCQVLRNLSGSVFFSKVGFIVKRHRLLLIGVLLFGIGAGKDENVDATQTRAGTGSEMSQLA